MKFFIKDFFSKCDQIRSFVQIWSHLLKKFLTENFFFCAVRANSFSVIFQIIASKENTSEGIPWMAVQKFKNYKEMFLIMSAKSLKISFSFWFSYEGKANLVLWPKIMRNSNPIFVPSRMEKFTVKAGSIFLSEAFQFIIAEKWNIQIFFFQYN